jgi:hypothetical protein
MTDKIERAKFAQKLLAITRDVGALPKNGWNDHFGYAFHRYDDIVLSLQSLLVTHGLAITVSVVSCEWVATGQFDRAKAELKSTRVIVEFNVIDSETGYCESFRGAGECIESQDKGVQKAMVVAHKYWLKHLFLISEGDDSMDEGQGESKASPMPEKAAKPDKKAEKVEKAPEPPIIKHAPETSVAEPTDSIVIKGSRAKWLGVAFDWKNLPEGETKRAGHDKLRDDYVASGFSRDDFEHLKTMVGQMILRDSNDRQVMYALAYWLESALPAAVAKLKDLLVARVGNPEPKEIATDSGGEGVNAEMTREEMYGQVTSALSWPKPDREIYDWIELVGSVIGDDFSSRADVEDQPFACLSSDEFDLLLSAARSAQSTGMDPRAVIEWRERNLNGSQGERD